MAHDADPLPLEQRLGNVGIYRHPAHRLDLRARNWLPIGEQTKGLEQRTRVARRPLRPQARHRGPVGAAHLDAPAGASFLDLDRPRRVIRSERLDRRAYSVRIGAIRLVKYL